MLEWRTKDLPGICEEEVQAATDTQVIEMLAEARTIPQCAGVFQQKNDSQKPRDRLATVLGNLLVANSTVAALVSATAICAKNPPDVAEAMRLVKGYFRSSPKQPTIQAAVAEILGLGWTNSDLRGFYLQVVRNRYAEFAGLSLRDMQSCTTLREHYLLVLSVGMTELALASTGIRPEHERRLAAVAR